MNPTHLIILALILIITLCMAMGYCLYASCSRAITAEYASQLQAAEDAQAARADTAGGGVASGAQPAGPQAGGA
jgi:hypothetical protein